MEDLKPHVIALVPSDGPLQCNNYLFAHSQVFLRTLGEGLRFKEGLALLEDRDYFYKLFWLAAGNTARITEPLYNYRVERVDSAVHDISADKALGAFLVSKEIFENEVDKGFSVACLRKHGLHSFLWRFLHWGKQRVIQSDINV